MDLVQMRVYQVCGRRTMKLESMVHIKEHFGYLITK